MKAQYHRKPHRIKKKRSILKSRFFWLAVLILTMISAISYFLVFSPFFEVKEIKISGNEAVKKEDIENLVQKQIVTDFRFFKNKNINLVALAEIDSVLLNNFVQIANVTSKKELPNVLEIQIQERKPAVIFSQNSNWFFADEQGIIFQPIDQRVATQTREQMTVIQNPSLNRELKLGDEIVEKEIISKVLDLESKFRHELKIPPKEIAIVSEDRLNVKTLEDWEAYFNLKGDLNWQFTELKTILEKKVPPEKRGNITYIDLRFENVYIFPETYNGL